MSATLEVVAELGVTNFTIDAVACRAGVGRATIYRRWSSKEELIVHAWASCVHDPDIPDTGSLRDDLIVLFTSEHPRLPAELSRKVLPQLLAAAKVNPELDETYRRVLNERRRPSRIILERAMARGELRADCDIDLLQDVLVGPFYYRVMMTDQPMGPAVIEQIIDLVLTGAAAAMASSPR